jgi:putative addiction module CopG family antidote
MPKQSTLNVRVGTELGEFIARKIGEHGSYENTSEYVRDLIRQDKNRAENLAFERLKAELQRAFSEPDDKFADDSAEAVFTRNPALPD